MRLQEDVDAGSQRALEAKLRRPDFQFARGLRKGSESGMTWSLWIMES